ncbi:MAG: 2Fe-2S iron-sulfur cluster-binding protein [Candidatus Latescibacteria bacterium]|nr:2Fe-2S iron-sulfur cluster-binding protein [Candidatus Latescibacterota bacterium]
MKQRLAAQPGEWIDRTQELEFRFEGETYKGYAGDVIASALWANGVQMTGRSFKYHRPRGIYSLAGHDANAMFSDGTHTHLRGDSLPLVAGMDLRAVNTFGGLKGDKLNWVELFSRFMPVGFYYKVFHRPAWLFPFHEKQIRKIAGLGEINPALPSTTSPKDYAWCDVLVVGGGAAGLEAALAAGRTGARVLLIEQQARLGGSLAWQHGRDQEAQRAYGTLVEAVLALEAVEVRCATMVGGHYADHWVALFDADRMSKVRAGAVVYAPGAIEQPAVFGHNDLPGVMLGSAAQRLVRLYATKPCERMVLLAANSQAYGVALDMLEAGVEVAAIADLRPDGEPSVLGEEVAAAGVPIHCGHAVYEAVAKGDKSGLRGAVVAPLRDDGEIESSRGQLIACDGIAVSVGWMPNAALLSQAGVKFAYEQTLQQLAPVSKPDGIFVAGRARGTYDLDAQRTDGRDQGAAAAYYTGREDKQISPRVESCKTAHSHPYPIFAHSGKKNFVDFDEDLHLTDFVNAHQEGYDSVELLKRYSTVGMGPSQGKLANMNAMRILAKLNGDTIDETGSTTSRPFYQPVPLGHLAGRRFHPMRQTPMHAWHAAHDAEFYHAGDWYRPEYYRRANTHRDECIFQEAQQVRTGLGVIDVGTLGKLLINGPDAVELLERLYTGRFKKRAVGRYRYAVALDESGVVIEDGVIARLAEDRFYVTATSSGVGAFYREMLRWAAIWGLDVTLSNATGQLAALNLAGPHSREALTALTDIDLSPEAFPYLGVREGEVAGVRALVMRVGFVGELGYEVHVPAWQGAHVWQSIFAAGEPWGVRAFGVEAQRLLRLEKGHLIVGHDTDALTHPYEAGLAWAIGKNKPFFVGQRSLQIYRKRETKRVLVGVRWPDGFKGGLPEECHLIIKDGRMVGRITSIAPVSTLGYALGMAFVEPDMAEPGTRIEVRLDDGAMSVAEVAALPFYDRDDERQGL